MESSFTRSNRAQDPELWWLTPAYVAGVMGVLLTLGAFWIPADIYKEYWRTPKYLDLKYVAIIISFAAAFCLGSIAGGMKSGPAIGSIRDWKRDLPFGFLEGAFNVFFVLSLLGYLVWGAAAVSRGANLDTALGVLRGEKGATDLMKNVYLITISGVTTLTQLAIGAGILGVLVGLKKGWKTVGWKFGVMMAFTIVRALMNSERLAIIELVIPAAIIFVRLSILDSPRWTGQLWPVLKAIPVFAFGGLFTIFGTSEYFRSWTNYYAGGNLNFFEFVAFRLLGYYATAFNNGALLSERLHATGIPFLSMHFLWRFPVISNVVLLFLPELEVDPAMDTPYMSILDREGNPEFNNGCGWLHPLMDFGYLPAILYWLVCGIVCGLLYRSFQRRQAWGLMLYPIIFISIVELPRILYWAEGRNLVPVLSMIPIVLVCVRYARQWRETSEPLEVVEEEGEWQISR